MISRFTGSTPLMGASSRLDFPTHLNVRFNGQCKPVIYPWLPFYDVIGLNVCAAAAS